MRGRRSLAAGALAIAAIVALPGVDVATAQGTPPGFVSVIFGRTQWVTTATIGGQPCTPVTGGVTLDVAKAAMDARGIPGTGIVITTRTPATGLACFNGYTLHPGWDLLQDWHADGWAFASGATHADVTTLDYEETLEESCGSLPTFQDHGIDATGLFAYGNNSWTNAAQADPVSRCYAYGRRYTSFSPNVRSDLVSPWMQKTHSVNGGNCNDASLACYTGGATYRYHSPVALAAQMRAAPDTWFAVQFYRLVQGKGTYSGHAWDCTSADWRRHWTSKGELYCYADFLMVMDALQAAVATGAVRVADPATVADAWGRTLAPPPTGGARLTATTLSCPPGTPTTCTASVRDTSDGTPAAPVGAVSFSTAAGGSFEPSSCQLQGVRPATSCSVTYTPEPGAASSRVVSAAYAGGPQHVGSQATTVHQPGVDTTPPAVQITNPPGSTVPRFVLGYQITASATDVGGIEYVRFYLQNNLRCTDTLAPYTCSWNTPKAGRRFQLRATARDRAGNEATVVRTITTV